MKRTVRGAGAVSAIIDVIVAFTDSASVATTYTGEYI